jgi:hypothetical protein
MRYEESIKLSAKQFRRLCGMKRSTFERALTILKEAEAAKRKKGGHESKLTIENMLLLTLEYLREYRTYFHIGQEFGIHETTAIRISRWAEDVLIKDGTFSLPGKKALLNAGSEALYEVVLIDATESPIERPKRGKKIGIPGKRSGTPKKLKS